MPKLKVNKDLSLVDRADREAARFDLERSLVVEAGAGTGKTTLLVDRILSLIRTRRASLEQIVAITFTEKAAGELKVRLREEIEKAIPQSRDAEREAFRNALGDLERAPISTIHSFCASLLRERPVEAKIDPNFEPLDEIGLDMLFQDTWESWLGEELERKVARLRRALTLGMRLDSLAGLVRQIYDNRDLVPAGPFPRPAYSIDDFILHLREGLKKILALAPDCRKEEDRGFQNIQLLREKVSELEAASAERKENLILRGLVIKAAGNKQNWKRPASCEEQKEIFEELGEELGELRKSIYADTMAGLVNWLCGFLRDMEEEKGKRGVLDFQDLLILSRNLLRENPEVRQYFQERFLYILVDEFQDTDPLQVEIVFFLAENGARAQRWQDVEISPGRLFLVGDPKQSIYRFRRADIETYESAKERLIRKGGSLKIFQNFRTVPSILSWVNRVFEPLIQPSEKGHFQPIYVPLEAYEERKEILPGQPGLILLIPPPDYDREGILSQRVREEEARSIAALIGEMTEGKGEWMIFDKKERRNRAVSFRDMAILFPTFSGIDVYEEALKARGIPFRLEGGKEFYYRQEVRSLLSCLKALDDPADGISLVAALRSPFFGFSDEEIFLFASSGNSLNYLPETKDKVWGEAFALLRGLHAKRNAVPISSTVADLLSRTKALEFSLLREGGEQVAANLRKVLDQARAFETEKHATFRRFVEWLGTREEEGIREGESPWAEEGEENVKMLTVHKAKGLEFPVVFLANLASGRNRRQEFIPLRLQSSFQVAMGEFKTEGYDTALEQEKLRMEAEDRRLFYVAATRAREYLIIPLFWGKRKGFFKMIEGQLPDWDKMKPGSRINGQLIVGGGALDLEAGEKPPLRLEWGEDQGDKEAPLQRRTQWKETWERIREKASRGLALHAPSASDSALFFGDEILDPGSQSAGGGKAFGLAFHEVMEQVDLKGGSNVKTLSQMKAAAQSIPEAADTLAKLCVKTIGHPMMDRVRQALRFYREVPFSVTDQEKIVEGKMDLLFEEREGWVIVDYKTDEVEGEALEKRFDSYLEQGRGYARAVKKATGRMVKEVNFFFVRTGEIRVLTDLE